MPAILLFGRRTILGGDDLQPAAYLTIIVRILQIIVMILPLTYHILNREVFVSDDNDDDTNNNNNNNNDSSLAYDNFINSSSLSSLVSSSYDRSNNITLSSRWNMVESGQQQQQQQQSLRRLLTAMTIEQCQFASYYFVLFLCLWLVTSFVFSIATIWLEWSIAYWSSIGPPIEVDTCTKIRSNKVQDLLEYKLFPFTVFLFIIWICGITAMVYAPQYYRCDINNSNNNNGQQQDETNNWLYKEQSSSSSLQYLTSNIYSKSFKDVLQQWWWVIPTSTLLLTQITEIIVSLLFLFQLWIQSPVTALEMGVYVLPSSNGTSPGTTTTTTTTNGYTIQVRRHEYEPTVMTRRRVGSDRGDGLERISSVTSLNGTNDRVSLDSIHIHNRNNNNNNNFSINTTTNNHELMEQMWERRCTNLCYCLSFSTCFMFGGRSLVSHNNIKTNTERNNTSMDRTGSGGAFSDVARALADYMEGTDGGLLDIVPSDIVMGLIVLQRLQRQRIYHARQEVLYEKERLAGTTTSNNNNTSQQSLVIDDPDPILLTKTTIVPTQILPNIVETIITTTTTTRTGIDALPPMTPPTVDDLQTYYVPTSPPTQQRERVHVFRRSDAELGLFYQESSRSILTSSNTIDQRLLQEAARYSKYALAIYTWPLYLYVYPLTGPCRLGCYSTYRCLKRNTSGPRTIRRRYRATDGDLGGYPNQFCCLCNCCDHTDSSHHNLERHEVSDQDVVTIPIPHRQPLSDRRDSSLDDRSMDWLGHGSVRPTHYHRHSHHPIASSGSFFDDGICDAHASAILLTADIDDETDLVYLQLNSSFTDNPYCILLDHEWKSVVVAIRGTFSLEDCVTDVLIDPEPLEQTGIEFGFEAFGEYCHGGVLACARNVLRDLDRHQILDELLLGDTALYPDYTLRLVGHSLGAATCTLLSYMLRRKFPTLRCCNYSPPGCTFTWKMAVDCQEWCTSYVIDSDIVPRLSFNAIERLRDETLELIGRVKVPKFDVTRRFVNSSALGSFRLCHDVQLDEKEEAMNESLTDILYETSNIPDSTYRRQLERFRAIQDERKRHRGTIRSVLLFPPGRIMHVIKTGEKSSCVTGVAKLITCCTTNMGSEYIPIWINNNDLNEIVVSPTMGTDHFPDRIRYILEQVADDFR